MALQIDIRIHRDEKYQALTATQKLALWEIAPFCPADKLTLKELIGDRTVSITSLVAAGFLAENPDKILLATDYIKHEKSTSRVQAYRERKKAAAQSEAPAQPIKIAQKDAVPDCPYQSIVDLYHKHCPSLPRVVKLSDQRQRDIRSRWRETFDRKKNFDDTLAFFDLFFQKVAANPFLTGQGSRGWKADIEFLMKAGKFLSIIEGKYDK